MRLLLRSGGYEECDFGTHSEGRMIGPAHRIASSLTTRRRSFGEPEGVSPRTL